MYSIRSTCARGVLRAFRHRSPPLLKRMHLHTERGVTAQKIERERFSRLSRFLFPSAAVASTIWEKVYCEEEEPTVDFDNVSSRVHPTQKDNLRKSHHDFIGRAELLKELEKALIPERYDPKSAVRARVLWGDGGIGKSEAACKFANIQREKFSYVWTIHAGNQLEESEDYKKLAEALKITSDQPLDKLRKSVHNFLETHSWEKPWLLILEDATSDVTMPFFGGSVLITSRDKGKWDPAIIIEVPLLTSEEAISLLKKITGEERSPQMCELAKIFAGYPLILNQIAHTIRYQKALKVAPNPFVAHADPISNYLDRLKENPLLKELNTLTRDAFYNRSMQMIWEETKKDLQNYPEALECLEALVHVCSKIGKFEGIFFKYWLEERQQEVTEQRAFEIFAILFKRGVIQIDGSYARIHEIKLKIMLSDQEQNSTVLEKNKELAERMLDKYARDLQASYINKIAYTIYVFFGLVALLTGPHEAKPPTESL